MINYLMQEIIKRELGVRVITAYMVEGEDYLEMKK